MTRPRAPVVADEHEVPERKPIDEGPEPPRVRHQRVLRGRARPVGEAEADEVRHDEPETVAGEGGRDLAIEKAPGRVAVQEEHGGAVARLADVHTIGAHVDEEASRARTKLALDPVRQGRRGKLLHAYFPLRITTSTRRFFCRPASVSLLATGRLSPKPRAVSLAPSTRSFSASHRRTDSARRSDRRWL